MKNILVIVSVIGNLSVLSACNSNKTITLPAELQYCSSQAQSDFSEGLIAYKNQDYKQSFELFSKASENNCANADFYLASQYQDGKFVPKNITLAKEKFIQACDKSLETACKLK